MRTSCKEAVTETKALSPQLCCGFCLFLFLLVLWLYWSKHVPNMGHSKFDKIEILSGKIMWFMKKVVYGDVSALYKSSFKWHCLIGCVNIRHMCRQRIFEGSIQRHTETQQNNQKKAFNYFVVLQLYCKFTCFYTLCVYVHIFFIWTHSFVLCACGNTVFILFY